MAEGLATNVIVLGAGGQVGRALTALAPKYGFTPLSFGSAEVDITDLSAVKRLYADHPGVPVINAAAYTAVDKAEEDAERAFAVNATAPAWLAALAGDDRPLLHFSTDYVFSGEGETPFSVGAPTAPLGVYGLSKRVGEQAVLMAPKGTVLRTAWVYSATGGNFLKTMLRVGQERGALKVVADQIGTPTHADDIASTTLTLLAGQLAGSEAAAPGLYHLTAKGQTSWHGFASEIFKCLEVQTGTKVELDAIPSTAYPTPAKRPGFSVLDCGKIDKVDGVMRPNWAEPVDKTVATVLQKEKADQ
ncbi:MAG: dTDP-4-dehydrorhamnose reductase [Pseudomonadota bacterium]